MDEQQDNIRHVSRRTLLGALGAVAVAAACGESPTSPSAVETPATGATPGTSTGTCAVTPSETIGPYPSRTDMFRGDIRESRDGTMLMLTIKVVDVSSACAPVSGAEVEIWQCDAAGNYSQYGSQTAATYLRGIQVTNEAGEVVFTTIYPGWYQGRATHIHVEVSRGGRSIKATQIAFPDATNNAVYATGVYAARGGNPLTARADGIFADSLDSELVTPSGNPASGYTATFQVGVSL